MTDKADDKQKKDQNNKNESDFEQRDKKTINQNENECKCGDECKCNNKETEEYKNKYLRTLADYHNLEKRISQQFDDIQKRANKNLILKFLEVLDNLEKAEIFVKDEGLKIIKDSFVKILKTEGVEEMDLKNKEYDPFLAECIEVVSGEDDNRIVEVLKKGYKIKGDVLRIAQVKVSQK